MATYLGFTGTVVGNTLKITPGNYGGVFMTINTLPTPLIIDGTGSVFSGDIYLPPTLNDVTFTNFTFQNAVNECFHWSNDNVSIGLRNVKFTNITATNCDTFCQIGSWADLSKQTSMSQNLEFSNITIKNCKYNNVFTLAKCYGTKFYNVVVNGAGSPAVDDQSHQGIVFLKWSDGEFYNCNIQNGGGNGFRVFPAGYQGPGNINIHDNYVGNMRKYSGVESNGGETPTGYSAVIHVQNNVFGNLAKGNYESSGLVIYKENGSKTYFDNNITFNTSKGSLYSGDGTMPDSNNNNPYYATAQQAGIDPNTGKPVTTTTSSTTTTSTTKSGGGNIPKTITSVVVNYSDGTSITLT